MEKEQPRPASRRLWEVDLVRGIGVVLMIGYHFMFDLSYFGVYEGNMYSGPWQIFARSIGSIFIFTMGVSLTLKYHRLEPRLTPRQLFGQYLLRGAILVGWGLVITVVTYLVIGRGFVIFGILHLLGLSTILAYPFLRSRWASLLAGVLVIAAAVYLNRLMLPHSWLFWLGLQRGKRFMLDWYPLFPWFGIALLGVFVGLTLWPRGSRRFALPDLSRTLPVRGLTYLGKHSLPIYLLHQPVILAFLLLVGIGSI